MQDGPPGLESDMSAAETMMHYANASDLSKASNQQ
jgi:hypothetical protein